MRIGERCTIKVNVWTTQTLRNENTDIKHGLPPDINVAFSHNYNSVIHSIYIALLQDVQSEAQPPEKENNFLELTKGTGSAD